MNWWAIWVWPNAIYSRLHPQEWEVEIDGKKYIFPRHDTALNNIETSLLKRRDAQFPNRSGDNGVAEKSETDLTDWIRILNPASRSAAGDPVSGNPWAVDS